MAVGVRVVVEVDGGVAAGGEHAGGEGGERGGKEWGKGGHWGCCGWDGSEGGFVLPLGGVGAAARRVGWHSGR